MITNPDEVELALRRAQLAVLNPDVSTESFLTMSPDELKQVKSNQLKFSRNAVCVDLSGPQLVDLAFVDLPGKSNAKVRRMKRAHCVKVSYRTPTKTLSSW